MTARSLLIGGAGLLDRGALGTFHAAGPEIVVHGSHRPALDPALAAMRATEA